MLEKEKLFSKKEGQQEQGTMYENNHAPAYGPYVWKYDGKRSGSEGYALKIVLFIVAAVAFVIAASILLTKYGMQHNDTNTQMYVQLFGSIIVVAIFAYVCFSFGQKDNGKQIAFART